VRCDQISREQGDLLRAALHAALSELGDDELKVLAGIEWLKENCAAYSEYLAAPAEAAAPPAPRPIKGFMREWCSFVSLYKDSYASGPNRFEVMTSLATERGLHITGLGIAGKPGGLVVEGEEGDVVAFMELMRTEFFETLNPRGRKLTTRLQERWPFDDDTERYEVAQMMRRLKEDKHRAADRAAGLIKKAAEVERLATWEAEERALVDAWSARHKRTMGPEEVEALLHAGPPQLFPDFHVYGADEGDGFVGDIKGAAKVFEGLNRMDGFDAMFTYRFS
jgi:hypothetical protein